MGLLEAGLASADAVTSMGTAFSGAKDQIVSGISTVAPYAVGVMVVFLVWKYGARFFKSVAK